MFCDNNGECCGGGQVQTTRCTAGCTSKDTRTKVRPFIYVLIYVLIYTARLYCSGLSIDSSCPERSLRRQTPSGEVVVTLPSARYRVFQSNVSFRAYFMPVMGTFSSVYPYFVLFTGFDAG